MKNLLIASLLAVIFGYSYYVQKSRVSFDPLNYELRTPDGKITLNKLKRQHKAIFMYFGFLSCPEACPTTLGTMANVITSLPKDKLEQVAFVFIDLDPERDSLSDIKNYTEFFHKKIIPVSIPKEDLDRFTEKFGIVYMKEKIESQMDYTINHSTDIIVLGQDGKLLPFIEHGAPKVVIIDRINKILNNEGSTQ